MRRGGERVRVSAQLIDADAGIHVWAERYDLSSLMYLQDKMRSLMQ